MTFEPISVAGNYFVAIDGEGVGNDYVLLDSSLDDYPRLYTGKRLSAIECLDWLWGLGKYAGYCTFVLYGAGYDFNNWLRDFAYDVTDEGQREQAFNDVVRLVHSQPVRVGNYLILWQAHFKFEIRKIRREDTSKPEFSAERYKYDRIQTRLGDSRESYSGLVFWDVLPFWQTKFTKALDMTLKGSAAYDRELIEEGKEARGTFTHENIEWVSRYNKAECRNLAYMMVELDSWFEQARIRPLHWNGPGSAAKAMLRRYEPYLHAGRRIHARGRGVSKRVREYRFPGADEDRLMLYRALSAYAGGLNRQLKIGYHPAEAYQYDLISAYPSAMAELPCLSHGVWQRTSDFDFRSFGLWKIRYKASRIMGLYPFFWRLPDGSIEYPNSFAERWVHTSELRMGFAVDPEGITVIDGWKWVESGLCDNPRPFWWIPEAFAERQAHKAAGNEGASIALKLPLNSAYGSIAQARGGTKDNPPWAQQLLWAGAITAYTRARLRLAYELNPSAIVHMATDGIISLEPLNLRLGKQLGEWEETKMRNLTCVQYGVYFADEWDPKTETWKVKHRERGFRLTDEEVPSFVTRVHDMWRGKGWRSMEINQRLFITAGLVAMSEKRYDEWCHWQDVTRTIDLEAMNLFQMGQVKSFPGMTDVEDASYNLTDLGASTYYEPKWGKGEDFPREWRIADEYDAAAYVSVDA